jgi:hypothetical protein
MRARRLFVAILVTTAFLPRPVAGRPSTPERHSVARSSTIIDNDDRMDVNNLDMVVTNHGSLAYDMPTGNAGLVYPKGSYKTAVFAAGLWVGAVVGGQTRLAVAEYSQDFVPGPMADSTYLPDQPDFRNYKIVRGNKTSEDYQNWPVSQGAPLDPHGDPFLLGDVTIWSVYNDANPAMHAGQFGRTSPLGIQIQQTVFAFNDGSLGNMIFFRWVLSNGGPNSLLDSVYVSLWMDPDLGGASDDLVGCDTTLALGYCYNATNADAVYGTKPPAVGFQLLRGPVASDTLGMTSFSKYIGGNDPANAGETYSLMKGLDRQGQPVHVLDDPFQPITTYSVSGLDPSAPSGPTNWLDPVQGEKRLMVSSGPFTLSMGVPQEIRAVLIVGQGNDRLSSIADLRAKAALARTLTVFDPPPPSPIVEANVDIAPNGVPLEDDASWVNVFIEGGFRPEEIQQASVRLAGVAPDPNWMIVGDHDGDMFGDLGLRFSRKELAPRLRPGVNYVSLTGTLTSGLSFEGSDELRVLPAPFVASNPVRYSGSLRFETATPGTTRLRVFDVTGRLLRDAEISALPAGRHELSLIGSGDKAGVFFYRLDTPEGTATGRFVLLK